jgi:hypothetical protein
MPLLLIPVASGLPAVRDTLRQLDEGRQLTTAELADLSRLVVRLVAASNVLLDYAVWLAGRPCRN